MQMQFNAMYVFTLKVAGDQQGIRAYTFYRGSCSRFDTFQLVSIPIVSIIASLLAHQRIS